MSNPTSNFGWQMPTATDLVTDLPADFEVFGQAVDTTLVDLKGGTTGQILAKNTNTDMDFVWITNDVGDITAVTAGTGISGGGTSGAVTITNSMATEITAKGDLIAGTGSATFDNLPVGTNGQILVADSTASTGLKWATPASGGTVVKVVMGQATSATSTSTSTYADTGLTATITPTSATSKILVIISQQFYYYKGSSQSGVGLKLVRGATDIWSSATQYGWQNLSTGGTQSEGRNIQPLVYLDSPSTTSATTYKTQGGTFNTTTVTWQESGYSQIILMEIGA